MKAHFAKREPIYQQYTAKYNAEVARYEAAIGPIEKEHQQNCAAILNEELEKLRELDEADTKAAIARELNKPGEQ